MEPLDLTRHAPRSGREKLDGLVMLPRTIDKMRALLPGGNVGVYHVSGFSDRLMDTIGIKADDLQAAVAAASSDQEVAAWVRAHADVSKYQEANRILTQRSFNDILPENRPRFEKAYPNHGQVKSRLIIDIMDADDAEMFGSKRT